MPLWARAISANGNRIAYPYVFEVRPGYLWITSMQGGIRAGIRVEDFR